MNYYLVAIQKFKNYIPGDIITEIKAVEELLSSEYSRFVARIAVAPQAKGN